MPAEPVHRTILVLDIVEFAHPQRTDPVRLRLREQLYELIHQTLTAAGEDPGQVPCVDLGDGVMVLLDPQLAAARVVEVVIGQLRPSLAALNRRAPGQERLRLRVALHRGEVLIDPHGFVGGALVEASRLSNAPALREQLDATAADLVLVVSDQVWKQLTGSRNDLPEPGVYQPISLSTHDVTTRAWMRVPGHPNGPVTMPSLRRAAAPVYRSIFAVDIQAPPRRRAPISSRSACEPSCTGCSTRRWPAWASGSGTTTPPATVETGSCCCSIPSTRFPRRCCWAAWCPGWPPGLPPTTVTLPKPSSCSCERPCTPARSTTIPTGRSAVRST
jgi:class 3 adenylate cyclase